MKPLKIRAKQGPATRMLAFYQSQAAEIDMATIKTLQGELLHVEASLAVTLARALDCYRRHLEAMVKAFHKDAAKGSAEAAMERLEGKIEQERRELTRTAFVKKGEL